MVLILKIATASQSLTHHFLATTASLPISFQNLPEQTTKAIVAAVEYMVAVDHSKKPSPVTFRVNSTCDFLNLLCPCLIQLTSCVAVRFTLTEDTRCTRNRTGSHWAPITPHWQPLGMQPQSTMYRQLRRCSYKDLTRFLQETATTEWQLYFQNNKWWLSSTIGKMKLLFPYSQSYNLINRNWNVQQNMESYTC